MEGSFPALCARCVSEGRDVGIQALLRYAMTTPDQISEKIISNINSLAQELKQSDISHFYEIDIESVLEKIQPLSGGRGNVSV